MIRRKVESRYFLFFSNHGLSKLENTRMPKSFNKKLLIPMRSSYNRRKFKVHSISLRKSMRMVDHL